MPDNLTTLNKKHWGKKLSDIQDGYPELLEALSRQEYNDEYVKHIEKKIKDNMIDYNKKIEQEFNDRINETTDEEEINLLNQEIKNISLLYNA